MKNRNQHSDTPKDQNDRSLVDPNITVTNANVDHQDEVTNPSQNPKIKMDSSDDSVRVTDNSGGQISLKVALDKQIPDEVQRGRLNQTLFTCIRSRRSAIGSVDSGSNMNPDIANIIDDTLPKAVMVINTVADVGSLGSGNANQSSGDDITMQGDRDKIGSQTDIEIYVISVLRTSERPMALGSNSSESSFGHIAPQRFYAEVTYDDYTYLNTGDVVQMWDKRKFFMKQLKNATCFMKELAVW